MRVPRPLPRTIRGRVTAVAVAVVAVALGLAGYATVRVQEQVLSDRVEDALNARGDDLAAGVTSGTLEGVLDSTGQEGGLAQVVGAGGRVVAATPNARGIPPVVAVRPPPGRQLMVRVARLSIDNEPFLVLARTVAGPSGPRTVLVAESLDPVESAREALIPIIAVGLPVILLLVGSVTALALRRALQPVERARREVDAIGTDRLDRRLTPLGTGDEVDRLTLTMNDLLDRLAAAYRREQQFVGDASHELRSPLASIRAQLEADLENPAGADPLRTETGVLEEVSRLEGLVDALLALARDQGAPSPPPTLLDMDDIVLDELRRLRPGTITVGTAGVSAGQVRGDRGDLERAVRNLLDNALRHARSRVDVTLAELDGRVVLTVANDGDPVAPAERERIFARFARTDAGRARDVGGAGLGLAIARAIVVRHGGTIEVDPDLRVGARFVVDLPAAVEPDRAPAPRRDVGRRRAPRAGLSPIRPSRRRAGAGPGSRCPARATTRCAPRPTRQQRKTSRSPRRAGKSQIPVPRSRTTTPQRSIWARPRLKSSAACAKRLPSGPPPLPPAERTRPAASSRSAMTSRASLSSRMSFSSGPISAEASASV